ncbi:centrosomin isoform X2 [Drosophila willistoni]|uniref:centrosomin isoform X2 n=1 Tax=Drosophila willistoni TaxID=7260 RepID=UPI000C26C44D|nr:centrosomin isoform X2 [Drosophila willistoni]
MAGYFRSTSLNNSNDGPSTPFKRYSLASNSGHSFNTCPSVIQDVTMENSYASFDVNRPPGGNQSPMILQGRSVRELEEQISALRKENFNLKLRIYFLEEGQPGGKANSPGGDNLSKQLIDSKVEIELLRKTVADKTELLKDAARAISRHEEIQKKSDMESQALIEQLQQHIRDHQQSSDTSASPMTCRRFKRMETEVQKMEAQLLEADKNYTESKQKIEQMEKTLQERQESLETCEAKIEELAVKNAKLLEQIDQTSESSNQANNNRELGAELADKICELQDAQEKLQERERIHEQACRTIQKLMQKLSSQEKEILKLQSVTKNDDKSSPDVGPTSLRRSLSDTETCSLDISHSLKERLENKIAKHEETIAKLQTEVKKKTANLQNLVNRELWEKNREVERLTQLVAAATQQPVPAAGVDTVQDSGSPAETSFTETEYNRALERNKLLQLKIDVLIKRLGESQETSVLVAKLQHELSSARADAESANKWRLECADVCGVLTNRLEELAGFLNSLLKHKDVLGVLAADRRHAIRKAVDRSLDLSKSLNMTLSITGVSLADQSLSQLCNLSEFLDTEGANVSNRTFNSHEEIHAASSNPNTIENLKAENKALKRELEKEKRRSTNDGGVRKERRSLPLPPQISIDNQSESEAWSEPDRKVSLARIGLEEHSAREPQQKQISESESDAPSCSARQERNKAYGERIAQLEEQIAQRDERILSIQCQLVELDNLYKQEQLRCMDLSQQLEQLRTINEGLTGDLRAIGDQEDQAMIELQRLVDLKTQQIDQLKLAQSTLTADAQVTEMELQAVQQQIAEMQQQHAQAAHEAQDQLSQCQMEAKQKLEQVRRQHQEALERDWVAMAIYQEQAQQLLELQRSLEYHQENEKELKQTLVENELASRSLKKQLDESTLQASKAVMERTKAYNDKMQLEKHLDELKTQLKTLKESQEQQQQQQQLQKKGRSQSSDVSQSGYTSEEVPLSLAPSVSAVVAQRLNNSSPDLGIESDAGRVSSAELSTTQRALLKTVEFKLEQQATQTTKDEQLSPESKKAIATDAAPTQTAHDCAKVDQENAELRRKLTRTKRAFEDTYEKLRLANKAKAQVEKDIKNQILKTHNVLRNVRSNMENEMI